METPQFETVPNTIPDEEDEDPLQKQFNSLQKQWDTIKHPNPRTNRRNSIAESTTTGTGDHLLFQLLDNSPKELMSSLQQHDSPPEGFICSGFKGRRLFEESEVGSDESEETQSECLDSDREIKVRSEFSCNVSDCDENCFNGGTGNYVMERRWMVNMSWIGVVIMMFALALVAFKCSGEDEEILVPT